MLDVAPAMAAAAPDAPERDAGALVTSNGPVRQSSGHREADLVVSD